MTESSGPSAHGPTLHIGYSRAEGAGNGGAGGAGGVDGPAVTVMALSGHLDIDSAGQLRSALEGLLATDVRRLVLDLGKLEFCDSVGLSALVDAHQAVVGRGGFVRLASPSPFLARVLGVVGLLGRLPVYDTVAGALADEPAGGRPAPPSDVPVR